LERVSSRDIFRGPDGRLYVHVSNGKGGRERDVHVLQKYEREVERIVREREGRDRLFDRVPIRMDVHSYRREYARERYREVEREISRERKLFDRVEDLVRSRLTRLYPDRFREIGERQLTRELTELMGFIIAVMVGSLTAWHCGKFQTTWDIIELTLLQDTIWIKRIRLKKVDKKTGVY